MSTNELSAKIRELKSLQQLVEEAEAEMEAIRDELKAHMTAQNTEEITVDVFKVRYTTVQSSRFDAAAFKKTHAELYAQYSKPTTTKRFTIV